MSDTETPPTARRPPGRPRKSAMAGPSGPVRDPDDPRIGELVEDDRWTCIVFPDDSQYRVEDGVIVERVR